MPPAALRASLRDALPGSSGRLRRPLRGERSAPAETYISRAAPTIVAAARPGQPDRGGAHSFGACVRASSCAARSSRSNFEHGTMSSFASIGASPTRGPARTAFECRRVCWCSARARGRAPRAVALPIALQRDRAGRARARPDPLPLRWRSHRRRGGGGRRPARSGSHAPGREGSLRASRADAGQKRVWQKKCTCVEIHVLEPSAILLNTLTRVPRRKGEPPPTFSTENSS